ncbi:MAG: class I SAM-dependent methyltransferase [bacterium]|nr:class I SAM-dependent methyltransferase [bacterium]
MSDWPDIRPDDRVLLTSIPEIDVVLALSDRLTKGMLVGLGAMEEVAEARQAAREKSNVMFQPGSAAEIPWQNEFFSTVIDTRCDWARPEQALKEILRALVPGGIAYLKLEDRHLPVENGFEERPSSGAFPAFRKP